MTLLSVSLCMCEEYIDIYSYIFFIYCVSCCFFDSKMQREEKKTVVGFCFSSLGNT